MTSNGDRVLRRDDAVRFLMASLEVLRGADDCGDEPTFPSTLEWLWEHTNLYITQLFCSDALKLHALRLPRFAKEMKRLTGGRPADGEDLDVLRGHLMTTIESALTEAIGKTGNDHTQHQRNPAVLRYRHG